MDEAQKMKFKSSRQSTLLRAAGGLLFLLFVLLVLIFMPVGTLVYWKGWALFISFAIPVIFITSYFMKSDIAFLASRVKAGPIAERRKGQQVIQAFAGLFFLLVVLVPGLDARFGWSVVPWYLSIVGDVLVVLGLVFVFQVFRENRFASAAIEIEAGQRVIQTGPYRFVRHPMYSGAFVMLVGIPLALGSWWGLLFVLMLVIVIIFRLRDEERFLLKSLPGYDQYREKVRYRLIPYVW
jgi:protein-S-isoprenylcysteine O-methyltransferase Ste14